MWRGCAWQARGLCPNSFFVNGHFKGYQRLGDTGIKAVDDFTPLVERISLDEAFADVAGCSRLFGPPAELAKATRRRVRTELGLPISIPTGWWLSNPSTELEFSHREPFIVFAKHLGQTCYWAI